MVSACEIRAPQSGDTHDHRTGFPGAPHRHRNQRVAGASSDKGREGHSHRVPRGTTRQRSFSEHAAAFLPKAPICVLLCCAQAGQAADLKRDRAGPEISSARGESVPRATTTTTLPGATSRHRARHDVIQLRMAKEGSSGNSQLFPDGRTIAIEDTHVPDQPVGPYHTKPPHTAELDSERASTRPVLHFRPTAGGWWRSETDRPAVGSTTPGSARSDLGHRHRADSSVAFQGAT